MYCNTPGRILACGLVIAASVGFSVCLSYATSCTCADMCNIDNVANEAKAAQWVYQSEILKLQIQDADSLTPTWYTPGRYQEVQNKVQASIQNVTARDNCDSLDSIRSDTNGGNCSITTQATTACMQEYAMAHERVHQQTCQSFDHFLTYQLSFSLSDMLAEEIRGYQTAIDMRDSMKKGPLKDCCCANQCTPTGPGAAAARNTLLQIVRNLVR